MTEFDFIGPHTAVTDVAALGFDERSRHALELAFRHHTWARIRLAPYSDACVAILDLDGHDSDQLWQQYLQTGERLPAVVVSRQPSRWNEAICVKKPLVMAELVTAIRSAAQRPQQRAGGTSAKAGGVGQRAKALSSHRQQRDTRARASRRRVPSGPDLYFKPDDFVLGAMLKGLQQARKKQRLLHIRCWGERHMIFDPERNEAHTDLSEKQLQSLGLVSVHSSYGPDIDVNVLNRNRLTRLLDACSEGVKTLPLEALVWKIAIATSRGRIPEGTDLQKPVYLRQWPNLSRLEPIPDAARVVALWVRQPRSLLRLFGSLTVPIEHILDLYSAACAIGLAGEARRNADSLFEPTEPHKHPHRELFASVIDKLHRTADTAPGVNGGTRPPA